MLCAESQPNRRLGTAAEESVGQLRQRSHRFAEEGRVSLRPLHGIVSRASVAVRTHVTGRLPQNGDSGNFPEGLLVCHSNEAGTRTRYGVGIQSNGSTGY